MAYVFSNPWQDAANFGGSIGERLAQALIQLPMQRQRLAAEQAQTQQQGAYQQATLGQGQQRLDIERQNAGTKAAYEGNVLDLKRQAESDRSNAAQQLADFHAAQLNQQKKNEQDKMLLGHQLQGALSQIQGLKQELRVVKANQGAGKVVPLGGQIVDPHTGKVIFDPNASLTPAAPAVVPQEPYGVADRIRSGLQKMGIGSGPAPAPAPQGVPPQAQQIKDAYKAGKLTLQQAQEQLKALGFE